VSGPLEGSASELLPMIEFRRGALRALMMNGQPCVIAVDEIVALIRGRMARPMTQVMLRNGQSYLVEGDRLEELAVLLFTDQLEPDMHTVWGSIRLEREAQDRQWGGQHHDDTHGLQEWLDFLEKQLNLIRHERHEGLDPRVRFVKIAALAVAAIESRDRVRDRLRGPKP